MVTRVGWLVISLLLFQTLGMAQSAALRVYLGPETDVPSKIAATLIGQEPGKRGELEDLLPNVQQPSFARYIRATSLPATELPGNFLAQIESLRLDKLLGSAPGASASTSLASRASVPAVLGFGIEHGGIQQENNGTVTTLRTNLLGVAKLALGKEQFPCLQVAAGGCDKATTWLRRFSGSMSFESTREKTGTVAVQPAGAAPGAAPVVADLFGNGFRMASWGVRVAIHRTGIEDDNFAEPWEKEVLSKLREGTEVTAYINASQAMFNQHRNMYFQWQSETIAQLQAVAQSDDTRFFSVLEQQLDVLIERFKAADPTFERKVSTFELANAAFQAKRDDLLEAIQDKQLSVEYTNQHPLNQPTTSNIRLVFSHQPKNSHALLSLNGAATWYNATPAVSSVGRMRDVQFAGQIDRHVGGLGNFGEAAVTFAGYYQWMMEDALITIGPGNVAPGSGIVLPGTAATMLGTKGHMGIFQAKLTLPASSAAKIPFSLTWSNRSELIKESDLRGQVGVTFDFDSFFH